MDTTTASLAAPKHCNRFILLHPMTPMRHLMRAAQALSLPTNLWSPQDLVLFPFNILSQCNKSLEPSTQHKRHPSLATLPQRVPQPSHRHPTHLHTPHSLKFRTSLFKVLSILHSVGQTLLPSRAHHGSETRLLQDLQQPPELQQCLHSNTLIDRRADRHLHPAMFAST
jgi:hypothetical protein